LVQHSDDFANFIDYTDDVPDFDTYVARIRSSADWGGHLELRVLALALQRPIIVYQAQADEPLVIDGEGQFSSGNSSENPPIRLSFHRQYYALGEHYNQVVETTT
jgi:OTU domain-containing protein 6